MVQEIITLVLIWLAIGYSLWNLIKLFTPSKRDNHAHKCAGCDGGCDLKSLHIKMHEQKELKVDKADLSRIQNLN